MILIMVLLNLFMAYQLYKIRHLPGAFQITPFRFYGGLITFAVAINIILFFVILGFLSFMELVYATRL